jgi:hypothetical protein
MLCVLMLRHMPWEYERYAERLPPLEAMKHLWNLSEVEGVSWRDATPKQSKLSESIKSLLDGMLEGDEETRMDMEAVAAHPWVNRELPREYKVALEVMAEQQLEREANLPPFSDAELAARLAVIEEMLQRAGKKEKGYKLVSRLPLTKPIAT